MATDTMGKDMGQIETTRGVNLAAAKARRNEAVGAWPQSANPVAPSRSMSKARPWAPQLALNRARIKPSLVAKARGQVMGLGAGVAAGAVPIVGFGLAPVARFLFKKLGESRWGGFAFVGGLFALMIPFLLLMLLAASIYAATCKESWWGTWVCWWLGV